jgi:hypothetical protein
MEEIVENGLCCTELSCITYILSTMNISEEVVLLVVSVMVNSVGWWSKNLETVQNWVLVTRWDELGERCSDGALGTVSTEILTEVELHRHLTHMAPKVAEVDYTSYKMRKILDRRSLLLFPYKWLLLWITVTIDHGKFFCLRELEWFCFRNPAVTTSDVVPIKSTKGSCHVVIASQLASQTIDFPRCSYTVPIGH